MREKGWRAIVVDACESLYYRDNSIMIRKSEEETVSVPFDQVSRIFINSSRGSITLPLLLKLSEHNVSVVFCDSKYSPMGDVCGHGVHHERAGRLMDQAVWVERRKHAVWRQIVKLKIHQQIKLLEKLEIEVPALMNEYCKGVQSNDTTNREALASRLYFDQLFGREFRRFDADDINAALNYGYTILRSAFNRAVISCGYRTELGIGHHSRQNPYNLSCDLMEPFRPFMDEIVYLNRDRPFDPEYRKKLISVMSSKCTFNNRVFDINDAVEYFTLDVMQSMLVPRKSIREVRFA